MPRKRKSKPTPVEVPLEVVPEQQAAPAPPPPAPPPAPAPAPPPLLPEGDRAAFPGSKRSEKRRVAIPEPVMPMNSDDVVNNVLCREINDPTGPEQEMADPNLAILDEITQGITRGTSVNHVKDEVIRIASNQDEKIAVVTSILKAIDLSRVNTFVQVREKCEKELKRAAMRGDLKSTEWLAFLRYSTTELEKILSDLKSGHTGNPLDTQSVIEKVDHAKQQSEAALETKYEDTTPLGREIIRKQIYQMRTKLEQAGKIKKPNATGPAGAK